MYSHVNNNNNPSHNLYTPSTKDLTPATALLLHPETGRRDGDYDATTTHSNTTASPAAPLSLCTQPHTLTHSRRR